MQFHITLDDLTDDAKSNMYVFRLGDDHLRFGDDKSVGITADADGIIKVKVVVDNVLKTCELYLADAKTPIVAHAPLSLKKSENKVVFGDGSSAVDGKCELISAEIKEY